MAETAEVRQGIQETKDVVKFVIRLGEAGAKSLEDGKFSVSDLSNFINAAGALPAAIGGIGSVPAELKDMDVDERAELLAYIKEEFDIAEENIEAVVEKALTAVIGLFDLIKEIIALTKASAGGESA